METELFASVEGGDFEKFKELIKKETKETIDQVRNHIEKIINWALFVLETHPLNHQVHSVEK